jgi:hypothetical protein
MCVASNEQFKRSPSSLLISSEVQEIKRNILDKEHKAIPVTGRGGPLGL